MEEKWAEAHFFVEEVQLAGKETVRALIEPLIRARRLSLYDLDCSRHGPTQVLRVVIDRPEGVDTETCATVSRDVSRALDSSDTLEGAYTLEVSSPGLERALKRPEHFAAVVGSGTKARVKVRGAVFEGEITRADEESFCIETGDGQSREVRYEDVVSARTVFVFPKKGARR